MSKRDRYVPMSYFDSLEAARTTLREESLLALEKQIEYLEWLKTPASRMFFTSFVEGYGGEKLDETDGKGGFRRPGIDGMVTFLQSNIRRLFQESSTYFVSRDMTEMIKMAAEEMPVEGLSPTDLLTETGFLYFHHPIEVVGPAGTAEEMDHELNHGLDGGNFGPVAESEKLGIRAILWEHTDTVGRGDGTAVPGVAYYLFTDADFAVETRLQALRDQMIEQARAEHAARGEELPEPITALADEDILKEIRRDTLKQIGPILFYDFSGWSYGRAWENVPYDEPARPDDEVQGVHPVVDQVRRLLLATWKMLNQKVVSLESEHPPRHMRRRGGRVMPETGDVVVIRLRREYHPNGSEEDAALKELEDGETWYTHRFLVKGHWRRQPCGTNKSDTKLIWIAPYVKGPEDRPLVIKSKIYALEH